MKEKQGWKIGREKYRDIYIRILICKICTLEKLQADTVFRG